MKIYTVCARDCGLYEVKKRTPGNMNHAGKWVWALNFFCGLLTRSGLDIAKENKKRFDFFVYKGHDPWNTR